MTQEFAHPNTFEGQDWYPDSSASHHITAESNNFTQIAPYQGSEKVHMGNGQGVTISSLGIAQFISPHNGHTLLTLNNLLHVPTITKNLVSVSQFARDNNVFFEFHPSACFVKSQVSKQVLLLGTLSNDGLYCFKDIQVLHSFDSRQCSRTLTTRAAANNVVASASSDANKCSSFSLWHGRLDHAHPNAIRTVMEICKIPYRTKTMLDFCNACCLGKSHRLHAPSSTHVYSTPFELVYSDLWGPSPFISTCGFSYYITFVDAHTKFTWIYFLKNKSEAVTAFKQFHEMVHTQFQATLKSLQIDGGGEFRPLTKYLTDLGITHRITCPHTSHQNGSVERKHRQVVETGLTLLAHASLPYKFWDHSFTTAVYLINRLPTVALPDHSSPYKALFHEVPDYMNLKIFGCACFPHIRPYNQFKLQFRSTECVYLGPSPRHKGHKCLSPDGRIYISKDVLFNEIKFPYPTLFPAISNSHFIPTCNFSFHYSSYISTFITHTH